MTADIQSLGRDYRRQLIFSALASRLPLSAAYRAAAAADHRFGPMRREKEIFRSAILSSTLPDGNWTSAWQRRVSDHGALCINIFQHANWNRAWFDQHVTLDTPALKNILAVGKGCLFLTYHHAFQHTLCSLLGLAGFQVHALAAPEETSPIYDQIGPYIRRLHRGCAAHFNGGDYLFFETPKQAIRMTNEALEKNSILISLNDFPSNAASDGRNSCRLLGRAIQAPGGSIRLAQRLGTPIVAGIAVRESTSYRVIFRRLDSNQPYRAVLQAYFDFLAELLTEWPGFWDGWNWFGNLPQTTAATGEIIP